MDMSVGDPNPLPTLPLKEIPGTYGLPFFGAIKDRLDYFWFQGENQFWESRMKKYNSTVFRTNVPPSPPGFPMSKVIMLLDQKSYPILFDMNKVEKKDVLTANYMPNTSFYGGIRPCVYLDPSEEAHYKLKSFFLEIIRSNAKKWIPETEKAMSEAFVAWENDLAKNGKSQFNSEASQVILNVLLRTIIGRDPSAPGEASLNRQGPLFFYLWLAPQLAPLVSVGLPHLLEELLLHTFRIPFLFVLFFYSRIQRFFETYGGEVLDMAKAKFGLERHVALHNLIFTIGFNAFGGLTLLYPSIIGYIAQAGDQLQEELVQEVREAVKAEGGLTIRAIQRMPLLQSTVYEVLRMSPPVTYQYAKAKADLVVESHDASFEVKKGEILGGALRFAGRDDKVFEDPNQFVASRFVGAQGKKLLRYVMWGNGPADRESTASDKQCAANDLVPFLAQIFLATFFRRYDSFKIDSGTVGGTHHFTSLNKAST